MKEINILLDDLITEKESHDLINFQKYIDVMKGFLKKMTLYPAIHDFIKNLLSLLLNAIEGMFEFSARFKFADLLSAEFSCKLEIPVMKEIPL
jgi:hypothetical protein